MSRAYRDMRVGGVKIPGVSVVPSPTTVYAFADAPDATQTLARPYFAAPLALRPTQNRGEKCGLESPARKGFRQSHGNSRIYQPRDGILLTHISWRTAMRYRVTHHSRYNYTEPVSLCHNLAHLLPRDHSYQRCLKTDLSVDPLPSARHGRKDFFGNHVVYFSIQQPHTVLNVIATSEIEITALMPHWRVSVSTEISGRVTLR